MSRVINKNGLPRNFNQAIDLEDLKFQVGEFAARLEDYLNTRSDTLVINSANRTPQKLPTFKFGDLKLDFRADGVATLQFWNGQIFISLDLGTLSGTIDLIAHGSGSGNDPSLFLRSDGAGGWVLAEAVTPDFFKTFEWKDACRVVSFADENLGSAPAAIDGETLINDDRILLAGQILSIECGIYQFNGTGLPLTRTEDADNVILMHGAITPITAGTNKSKIYWSEVDIFASTVTFVQVGGPISFALLNNDIKARLNLAVLH